MPIIPNPIPSGTPIHARIGPADAVIELEHVVSLRADSLGRWSSFRLPDAFYRRTVDGGVVQVRGVDVKPEDVADASDIHESVRCAATVLREGLGGRFRPVRLSGTCAREDLLAERLERIAAWDNARFQADHEEYLAAYPEPVLILPPDRALDLVLMPTVGCPYGLCDFCRFYRNRPFRVLEKLEYERHLSAVDRFWGPAVHLRKGLFLGAGNALALSQVEFLSVLRLAINKWGPPQRGVASFWDPDHSPVRGPSEWRELADAGLTKVIAGLETGHALLRQRLGKSEAISGFIKRVNDLKAGDISVGITVLAGIGSFQEEHVHIHATMEAIRNMNLGIKDIIYVSSMDGNNALAEQLFTESLKASTTARVIPYRLDTFRYYT